MLGPRAGQGMLEMDEGIVAIVESFDTQWCYHARQQLKRWFARNHRDMPWRRTRDPYHIWVSEIMLQQTQVATVLDYYRRFIERFPTVRSLASARQSDVLKLWAGLGYYRRAKHLHLAAQQLVQWHDGQFPRTVEQLRELAGVGRYTAGAIASFAFDQRAPILEANTIRLLSRLIGLKIPVQSGAAQKQLWTMAETLLPPRSGSGQINQALMELGSLVCTPKSPECSRCPLSRHCRAHQQGIENVIPVMNAKPDKQILTHVGLIVRDAKQRMLLRQNPTGGWWEGLWDLPWVQWPSDNGKVLSAKDFPVVRELFAQQLNLVCQPINVHQSIRHAVTRYHVHYHCLAAELDGDFSNSKKNWRWVNSQRLPPMVARFARIRFL